MFVDKRSCLHRFLFLKLQQNDTSGGDPKYEAIKDGQGIDNVGKIEREGDIGKLFPSETVSHFENKKRSWEFEYSPSIVSKEALKRHNDFLQVKLKKKRYGSKGLQRKHEQECKKRERYLKQQRDLIVAKRMTEREQVAKKDKKNQKVNGYKNEYDLSESGDYLASHFFKLASKQQVGLDVTFNKC